MFENVVGALLSVQFRPKDEIRCQQAEDSFYEQFGQPLPRWLTGPARFLSNLKTAKGSAAVPPLDRAGSTQDV
ncbi:hypothetical protein ATN84_06515 [Paramesorhizobium deserti]|uniref:Uncharacterized protein n=2 Tax=Paramesorhizobium deserti TaxID=1494590 RepID=A0A135I1N4_9HYPH|nr:hypothetical protein ATN84_06515 [Paramesorhizobium deserti]